MQVNPTIAAGDFKVSIDGGALANLGTLPAVTPASSAMVKFTLSTSEMAGANATVVCSDAAGAEWCDATFNIQTTARQIDDLAFPATSGRSMVVDASGLVDANMVKLGPTGAGTAQTARDIGTSVLLSSGTGTGQLSITSGIAKVDVDTIKTNPVVNAGTITFPTTATLASTTNITAGTIATVTTVTNQLTAAAIATGVWQDATAGDFTTASSIGKALYVANIVPGAAGGHFIAGTNAATTITTGLTTTFTGNLTGSVGSVTGAVGSVTGAVGSVTGAVGSVTGAVGSVTGLTASNLDATISSRMATYTQPTGFLAATFPTGTVANTTNITAGTITTATNLTNAPTAGDFTATMKTSIGTAVAASAVASVTGNVGGNVTGSIGSLATQAKTDVENTVWNATMASHVTGGSTGASLNGAGSAGDPWTTSLPGAYGAGTAGSIVGNNLNATISSVKAKTDQLTFTVANQVDANAESCNATTINGTGTAGDLWRGA